MRLRTLSLLFLAFLLAGGGALLARSWLAAQRARAIAEAVPLALPAPAKSVLVARSEIQRGKILRPEDFAWQVWPSSAIDRNYVVLGTRTPESFAGWVARDMIAGGEPVTEAKIVAPGNRGFLAAALQPGTRAVSVPVTANTAAAGFILPGDRVDLLVSLSIPGASQSGSGQRDRRAVQTLLEDVRVIAIDQKIETNSSQTVIARSATLEVTPKQAEMIALASDLSTENGNLVLVLRSLIPAASDNPDPVEAAPPEAQSGASASFTVDSDINPLPSSPARANPQQPAVPTILRGGAAPAAAAPPAGS
jgi:pilus assembly protein CpaB